MAADDRKTLTQKQRRFVVEFAADGIAVQAYFRAFGRLTSQGKPRAYRAAQVESSKLLSNPIIQAEVEAANADYEARTGVTKERVIRELAAIAFSDPDDVYESDPDNGGLPAPKPWAAIPPAARKAIQAAKVKRRRIKEKGEATQWEVEEIEYRFHSKTDALDKLCKKLGLYGEGKDDEGGGGGSNVELLARLAALIAARQPDAGGRGGGAGGPAVGTEPGAAEPGVPEPG